MKKLIGFSIIVMLAVAPAFADPVAGEPIHVDEAVTAEAEPGYALVEENQVVDGIPASIGYVKGAYNASIKAINKLTDSKQDALTFQTSGTGAVVTDVTVSDGSVTVNKSNVQIPVGSSSATTYANIWVQ